MAQYPKITITNAGLNMIAESQGGTSIIFTKMVMGDGLLADGENIKVMTNVKNAMLAVPLQGFTNQNDGQIRLRFTVSNSNLETGFFAREIGVFAKMGATGAEQLYAYTNAGNKSDYLPDKSVPLDSQILDLYLIVGNASGASAILDVNASYMTKQDLNDYSAIPKIVDMIIKNGLWADVRAFGAVGDGITDDTLAIQKAIDSFKYTWRGNVRDTTYAQIGGTVFFPPGTYRITSKIRLAPALHIKGAGKSGYYGRKAPMCSIILVDYSNTRDFAIDTSPYNSSGNRINNAVSYGNSVNDTIMTGMDAIHISNISFVCNTKNSVNLFNIACSPQFLIENVSSYGFQQSVRITASWMSCIRDCQFYSGWRGIEFGHSCNNVTLSNVTLSRVGETAKDTQTENIGESNLTNYGTWAWQNSCGILAHDASYITGQGITIEGYNDTLICANYSNIDINSLWVEGAGVLVRNNYSVVKIKVKFLIGVSKLLNSYYGRNFLENLTYNINQEGYTTGYTKVIDYFDNTSPETVLINLPYKPTDPPTNIQYRNTIPQNINYSTGNWSPLLLFGGNSAGVQSNYGKYTIIGNMVFATFYITVPTLSTATGVATISGLPNPALDTFGVYGSGVLNLGYASPVTGTHLKVESGKNYIGFVTTVTNTSFGNGVDLRGTIQYTI